MGMGEQVWPVEPICKKFSTILQYSDLEKAAKVMISKHSPESTYCHMKI